MADIYWRSVSRWQPGVTLETVNKLIRDAISKITGIDVKKTVQDSIAETLNLVEIFVFGDRVGKLQTSNVSVDDILTRQRGLAEGTITLYSDDGQLRPGTLVSTITDALADHSRELEDYVKCYNNFRKNVVFWEPRLWLYRTSQILNRSLIIKNPPTTLLINSLDQQL